MGSDEKQLHCLVLTSAAPAATEIRHHSDGLVKYVIADPVESAGYQIHRMDDMAAPGTLSDSVLRELYTADLVIADLSFADPTVMYALGVRHSFAMTAIHLLTPSSTFPFDIDGLTGIVFDINDLTSVKRARKELAERIAESRSSREVSPVHATVELDQVMRGAAPAGSEFEGALVNGLRAIEQRLDLMERRFGDSASASDPTSKATVHSRRIFIVHGHDGELKHQLARLLQRLQFDPVILQEMPDSGRTLIEKLRTEIDEIGFVFVLITADDEGRSKEDAQQQLSARARQNVVFEHGLFSAFLEPSRVCAIQRGQVEIPSDLYGLVIKKIPETSGIDAISLDIVRELQRAGYDVDANLLMED